MSNEIKQDELYEDLSTLLVLIRKIFRGLIIRSSQKDLSQGMEHTNEESIILGRCAQLIIKYKRLSIKKEQNLNILGRFMCRIKEILSQITVCIPKEKLQIVIILKKLELITTSVALILSLLEILSNSNVKLIHSLKIKSTLVKEQKSPEKLIERQSSCKERDSPKAKVESKQNELQMLTKNMQIYSSISIDKEFFRGRYFDMKSQDNSSVLEEITFRNRNIKSIMTEYEKDYNRYATRKNSKSESSNKNEEHHSKRPISWEIHSVQESSNLFKTPKRQISSRSSNISRNVNNKSNQTLSYTTMEESAELGISSYRSMYESKLTKSRNKKVVKLSNTIIDLPSASANPNAKQISTQRWNFYKKSQEHLKFRYKYYQNKSFNTTPLSNKYKSINPQILYNNTFCK